MSNQEQPAPAYRGVEHENDPGLGTAIAEEAPAESGTLSSASDERTAHDVSTDETPQAPGRSTGDEGFPTGSTETPPADDGVRTGGAGVSGRQPGPADLENPGGTGLTTTDTEGA
ncbi:hypothetical protein [Cryptosporangium arvum]|uniref:hypothetical protein n=1 Tax=Cryptosporangium arvum TaxID=80871 RepID=UPI0012EEACC4|nr:hypothetical protein [Cryptosporangium arvum]